MGNNNSVFLVDSGASHNFISYNEVSRLNLTCRDIERVPVRLADKS